MERPPTNVARGFWCFSNLIGREFYFAYLKSFLLHIGEGNGNPLQYSRLKNPMDGGAW